MAVSAIAKIYARKVANGDRTLESVPDTVLPEVKAILGIEEDNTETEDAAGSTAETEDNTETAGDEGSGAEAADETDSE